MSEWSPSAGGVSSVAANDTSVVVSPTTGAVKVNTAGLDVISADHAATGAITASSQKITNLANGSAATDAAAFGQLTGSGGALVSAFNSVGISTTMVAGQGYIATANITLTTPASPSVGQVIPIINRSNSAITIAANVTGGQTQTLQNGSAFYNNQLFPPNGTLFTADNVTMLICTVGGSSANWDVLSIAGGDGGLGQVMSGVLRLNSTLVPASTYSTSTQTLSGGSTVLQYFDTGPYNVQFGTALTANQVFLIQAGTGAITLTAAGSGSFQSSNGSATTKYVLQPFDAVICYCGSVGANPVIGILAGSAPTTGTVLAQVQYAPAAADTYNLVVSTTGITGVNFPTGGRQPVTFTIPTSGAVKVRMIAFVKGGAAAGTSTVFGIVTSTASPGTVVGILGLVSLTPTATAADNGQICIMEQIISGLTAGNSATWYPAAMYGTGGTQPSIIAQGTNSQTTVPTGAPFIFTVEAA